ncbi:hypothetical protein DEJ50_30805 [Streptomyces venezuelae]|uniref:Uncharacterized protein n=1 Tax=Streptomyces venezuelae TaxID=54571 RepID=A0A5P2D906_STRVZ|nr:hypothetical protein [Streptomyces venezuelae]QES51585.1 hypothetical protein DEJ50_30805 [Streptomyces venezuelae]
MADLSGRTSTSRRSFLILLGVTALPVLPAAAGCAAPVVEDHLKVQTRTEPLRLRFAAVGEMSDPHWLGYDIDEAGKRQTIPGQDSRIRMVGVARLPKGAVTGILQSAPPGDRFEPAALPADIPAPLVPHLPVRDGWHASTGYDARILAAPAAPGNPTAPDTNDRADGRFFLHEERDLVWFDVLYLSA